MELFIPEQEERQQQRQQSSCIEKSAGVCVVGAWLHVRCHASGLHALPSRCACIQQLEYRVCLLYQYLCVWLRFSSYGPGASLWRLVREEEPISRMGVEGSFRINREEKVFTILSITKNKHHMYYAPMPLDNSYCPRMARCTVKSHSMLRTCCV